MCDTAEQPRQKTYFQSAGMLKILRRHKYMYRNLLTADHVKIMINQNHSI